MNKFLKLTLVLMFLLFGKSSELFCTFVTPNHLRIKYLKRLDIDAHQKSDTTIKKEVIKKYKEACLIYHPDKQVGKSYDEKVAAEVIFKKYAEAKSFFDLLKDEQEEAELKEAVQQKRQHYSDFCNLFESYKKACKAQDERYEKRKKEREKEQALQEEREKLQKEEQKIRQKIRQDFIDEQYALDQLRTREFIHVQFAEKMRESHKPEDLLEIVDAESLSRRDLNDEEEKGFRELEEIEFKERIALQNKEYEAKAKEMDFKERIALQDKEYEKAKHDEAKQMRAAESLELEYQFQITLQTQKKVRAVKRALFALVGFLGISGVYAYKVYCDYIYKKAVEKVEKSTLSKEEKKAAIQYLVARKYRSVWLG